jgi:oxygen-independent coproporphyrinogen-3 oxidase
VSFAIYIHWPFCAAKCPYCDFNSHVRAAIDADAWAESVSAELGWAAARQTGTVESVFFGGGTPSLMPGRAAGKILARIAALWPVAAEAEITLEANPASADAARFADYAAAGVNRVSLGVQALNDADLKALGRLHSKAEALAALRLATTHFARVSLDLIYARPGQGDAAWRAELKEALSFGTGHLSLYQLTIEPDTPYALLQKTGALVIPEEDQAAGLYETTQELTEAAGLAAYEISNHARPGAESRHNLVYWRYGDYVGAGPGAHGRLSTAEGRIATAAIRLPERWQDQVRRLGHGYGEMTAIGDEDAAREHLMMSLRLAEGLDLAGYAARWGQEVPADRIAALAAHGLVTRAGNILRTTPKGRLLLNGVTESLVNP